jgi:plastocyanin
MRSLRQVLLLPLMAAVAVVAACGGSPSSAPAAGGPATTIDPATAALVNGRVRYEGVAPAAEVVRISGDKDCVSLSGTAEQSAGAVLLGADNALQNVFVYVKSGLEKATFPIPNDPVVLDQQKCRYVPRVLGVRVGQALQVKNGDALLHNVRSDPEINQPFNQGQPVQGMAYTHTFTTREVMVPIKCDVHPWMRAYVGAVEHPYFAVTGEDGAFTLPNLPPGTYMIAAWHERLGAREQQVTLGAKDTRDVDFTFTR